MNVDKNGFIEIKPIQDRVKMFGSVSLPELEKSVNTWIQENSDTINIVDMMHGCADHALTIAIHYKTQDVN